MDKDLANLIRNSIPNDYCKLFCLDIMEEDKRNSLNDYCEEKIMIYCFIYDNSYFVDRIYKEKDFNKKGVFDRTIRHIYLYNLLKNKKHDEALEKDICDTYKKEKDIKQLKKDIDSLSELKFDRRLIKYYYNKKKDDIVIRNHNIISNRLSIISDCITYKLLIKLLNLEENKKIDRLLNWNISRVKKCNTIEDKLWFM